MRRSLVVVGMAIGASLMYVLDPQQGRRRRALARDTMARAVHETGRAMGATSRDVAHRATGLAATLHSRFFDREAPDEVVEARVRAAGWPPGTVLVGVAGAVLTTVGLVRRDKIGMLLTGVGIAVVTRAGGDAGLEHLARMVSRAQPDEARGIPIPVKIGPPREPPNPRPAGNVSDRIH